MSGDPATVGTNEESGDICDVLGLPDPLQRLARLNPFPAIFGPEEIGSHVRVDCPGRDGVDPDPALAELGGKVARQRVDRALGEPIGADTGERVSRCN